MYTSYNLMACTHSHSPPFHTTPCFVCHAARYFLLFYYAILIRAFVCVTFGLYSHSELAARISKDYAGKKVLCVGLLAGAFMFMSDLLRQLTIAYDVDFMVVSSYGK